MAEFTEVYLIGDDGEFLVDDVECTSAQTVTLNFERTEIDSNARGSDRTATRSGKLKVGCELGVRVEPNDAVLASLIAAIKDPDTDNRKLKITIKAGDEGAADDPLEEGYYTPLTTNLEQPLEEEQTGSISLSYHSEVTS